MKRLLLLWLLLITTMFAAKPELLLLKEWEGQDVSGWLMSEKMDGVRAYWDGKKLISRGGVELAALHGLQKVFLRLRLMVNCGANGVILRQLLALLRKKRLMMGGKISHFMPLMFLKKMAVLCTVW